MKGSAIILYIRSFSHKIKCAVPCVCKSGENCDPNIRCEVFICATGRRLQGLKGEQRSRRFSTAEIDFARRAE